MMEGLTFRYFQLVVLLMVMGPTLMLWQRSLTWYSDAQKSTAEAMELEKQLLASKSALQKLERQATELRVRGDDVRRRLSDEGAELVATQNQLEHCRGSLTVCKTEKNALRDQKKTDTRTSEKLKEESQALRGTLARLQVGVQKAQGVCAQVMDGRLEEARKLCQAATLMQMDSANQNAEKGRK